MRTFLLYAILVGVPVVGTSLILEGGRDLQAPPAVAGRWAIETARDATPPDCPSSSAPSGPLSLTIGQSGDSLTIALGDAVPTRAGRLDWRTSDRPAVATLPSRAETIPVEGALVDLHATVDSASAPPTMQGTMTTIVCGNMAVGAFRATWRPDSQVKAGKH